MLIRPLRAGDVAAAAALHQRVFRDYFLGHMGQRFLELFYAQFVDSAGSYGLVAVRDDRVVGAVIGSIDLPRLFHVFYRRHFGSLAVALVVRFVRDRYVRQNLADRLGHVGRAARSLLARHPRTSESSEDWPPAQLLSIGVDDDVRGRGVAEALVTRFCEALAADGVDAVGLSVRPANARAIAFYTRTGWLIQRGGPESITFWRAVVRPAEPSVISVNRDRAKP